VSQGYAATAANLSDIIRHLLRAAKGRSARKPELFVRVLMFSSPLVSRNRLGQALKLVLKLFIVRFDKDGTVDEYDGGDAAIPVVHALHIGVGRPVQVDIMPGERDVLFYP
jgi:hypothetical protein